MMKQSTKTYLQLVNDTIEEAGDDLASFASDGSDFATATDAMMVRFKKWVKRAWRDIQQESFDWEWMSEQAVVNITPGIMFYSPHVITWTADQANPLVIYDVDDTATVQGLMVSKVVDLTGTYTTDLNFGYINALYTDYSFSEQHTLDFGMKAGGEYFLVGTNSTVRIITSRDRSSYVVGTPISSIILNTYDNDHILISTGTYTLTGVVSSVELTDGGLNTVLVITYTHIAPNFWNDYLTDVPPAFGAGLILNNDGVLMSVSGETPIGNPDSAITPYTYSITATGVVDVIGGTISVPIAISAATITISAGQHDMILSGSVDAATDGVSAVFTILNDKTNSISGIPFTLFSQLASQSTDFDHFDFALTGIRTLSVPQVSGPTTTTFAGTVPESELFKNYIHSWKSYDWSEELDDDDFQEKIREIDQKSFRIITHDQPAISPESPLTFVPWDEFQNRYDFASTVPAVPLMISEDNTGRWRFYPPLNEPYTVLFDYVREPQIFSAFDDVPKGLPEEYEDIIMYKALEYYGLYDEQPSIASPNPATPGRSQKAFKDLLMKFELQTRPKFHFKPAKVY